jgi:hypothetical protein
METATKAILKSAELEIFMHGLGRVDEFTALAYVPLYDAFREGTANGRTLALH